MAQNRVGSALRDLSARTGIAARTLPPRPHPGPGCAAGGDGGRPGVHLCLGDGVFPHDTLQPPRQVGQEGAGRPRTGEAPLPVGSSWPVSSPARTPAHSGRVRGARLT